MRSTLYVSALGCFLLCMCGDVFSAESASAELFCTDPDTGVRYPVNSTWLGKSFCGTYTCHAITSNVDGQDKQETMLIKQFTDGDTIVSVEDIAKAASSESVVEKPEEESDCDLHGQHEIDGVSIEKLYRMVQQAADLYVKLTEAHFGQDINSGDSSSGNSIPKTVDVGETNRPYRYIAFYNRTGQIPAVSDDELADFDDFLAALYEYDTDDDTTDDNTKDSEAQTSNTEGVCCEAPAPAESQTYCDEAPEEACELADQTKQEYVYSKNDFHPLEDFMIPQKRGTDGFCANKYMNWFYNTYMWNKPHNETAAKHYNAYYEYYYNDGKDPRFAKASAFDKEDSTNTVETTRVESLPQVQDHTDDVSGGAVEKYPAPQLKYTKVSDLDIARGLQDRFKGWTMIDAADSDAPTAYIPSPVPKGSWEDALRDDGSNNVRFHHSALRPPPLDLMPRMQRVKPLGLLSRIRRSAACPLLRGGCPKVQQTRKFFAPSTLSIGSPPSCCGRQAPRF